jgi:hypothetical protein
MRLRLRLYGNLAERTWKLAEEPPPELEAGKNPWMLLWEDWVETGPGLDNYPKDWEQ